MFAPEETIKTKCSDHGSAVQCSAAYSRKEEEEEEDDSIGIWAEEVEFDLNFLVRRGN